MNNFPHVSWSNFWTSGIAIVLVFAVDHARSSLVTAPYLELLTAVTFGVITTVLLMLTLMTVVVRWTEDVVIRPFRESLIALGEACVSIVILVAITLLFGLVVASIVVAMWFVALVAIELSGTVPLQKRLPSSE